MTPKDFLLWAFAIGVAAFVLIFILGLALSVYQGLRKKTEDNKTPGHFEWKPEVTEETKKEDKDI